jgi:hypothetical protein
MCEPWRGEAFGRVSGSAAPAASRIVLVGGNPLASLVDVICAGDLSRRDFRSGSGSASDLLVGRGGPMLAQWQTRPWQR